MSGYTKLFNRILHSTIWREDDKTRILWITMLAMANQDGVVESTIPGLADMARVSLEDCESALERFQQPDKYSWSKEDGGRRIRVVDGGWYLINHDKYRNLLSKEDQREKTRLRVEKWRARQAAMKGNAPVTEVNVGNDKQKHLQLQKKGEGVTPKSPLLSESNPTELARLFLEHEEICIPVTKFEISDTASALEAIQKQEKLSTPFEAMEWALEKARAYKKASKVVGPGWMRKALYNQVGPKKQVPMVRVMDLIEKERTQ